LENLLEVGREELIFNKNFINTGDEQCKYRVTNSNTREGRKVGRFVLNTISQRQSLLRILMLLENCTAFAELNGAPGILIMLTSSSVPALKCP